MLQDVFDTEFKDELEELYTTKVWSEISDELKENLIGCMKSGLKAVEVPIPTDKVIMRRMKGFY